jgi:diguanylate cyclase (GGDEF)-like protein
MDKSQLLLEKMDLPRPKNYRFSVVMKNFSLISLICIFLYAVLFAVLSVWQMVLVCGVCALLWVGILVINRQGFYQIAFLIGAINSTVFALLTTWLLGWSSGFFLMALIIIPIIFHNSYWGQIVKVTLAFAILAVIIGLFILSWQNASFWALDEKILRTLLAINLAITVVVLAITGHYFETSAADAEKALIQANKKLAGLATTDPVTNLVNRRIILSRIEQEKNRMERGSKPFTLIMVDIDNFKHINDEYGHSGGDTVLVNLAEAISFTLRKQDEVARWGGDEFLIMLPETDVEGGVIVAEKIRTRIVETPFLYRELEIPVTITLGVSACEPGNGVGSCIRKADQALYAGKQAGKNRVGIIQTGN